MSVAALALMFASTASATTFPIGTVPQFYITSGTPFSNSITANFGNGFNSQVNFDDSFTFTIPTKDGVGSGSISTSFSSPGNHLVINQLWVNGTLYAVPATSSGQSLTLNGVPITHGVLNTIRVVGVSGPEGGSYAGTATFAATAVPEAGTWAMMLGGFGLMGVVMRRRQSKLAYAA